MTAETRERIKQYEKDLPHVKEKITAAAVLLVIAMTIMVTATYAWVTLSASPEVTSIDTTVTANGALEIAMANGTGEAPGKSAAGDSTGAGKDVTQANITWGNLVNLSDPSYGLSRVTLRPAGLNTTGNLLVKPLWGISYGADGRVSGTMTSDEFGFTYYDEDEEMFLAPVLSTGEDGEDAENNKHLGVRAISSIKYVNLEGKNQKNELLDMASKHLQNAVSYYDTMTNTKNDTGKANINTLQALMQKYAQSLIDNRGSGGLSRLKITADEINGLYNMLAYFNNNVMSEMGKSYVMLANLLELTSVTHAEGYVLYDWVSLDEEGNAIIENGSKKEDDNKLQAALTQMLKDYDNPKSDLMTKAIKPSGTDRLPSFKQYSADMKDLAKYLDDTVDFNKLTDAQKKTNLVYWKNIAGSGGTVYWTDIQTIINWMCSINTATLDGYKLSQLTSLGIAQEVMGNKSHEAILHDGAVKRAEQRMGAAMSPQISIVVDPSSMISYLGPQTINTPVKTDAKAPYEVPNEIENLRNENSIFQGGTPVAEDTYALAVDLWLRTNAGAPASVQPKTTTAKDVDGNTVTTVVDPVRAYITLEGKIHYKTDEVKKTVTDSQGKERDAYMASATVGDKQVKQEVFKRGEDYFYFLEDGEERAVKDLVPGDVAVTYTPIMEQKQVVSGYDGVNRVWSDDQMMPHTDSGTSTSTTQGGGSCYTFYVSNEADMSRFLELLGSIHVAFIDKDGNLIGKADMDTGNHYAENGKVTVPLALDTSSAAFLGYKDEDGTPKEVYGLMPLLKNAATSITAIVYLDGTNLTNQMVLAGGDIQGNLNIQFGSYTAVKTTVTTTDAEGNEVKKPQVSYDHDVDNEAIEDDPLMDDTIRVTAKLTGNNEFVYNENKPASTSVEVTVEGSTSPRNVEVRFIRAISSTQGVLQDAVSLTKNGDKWTGNIELARPGNYVLRTVWVDGVEYDMDNDPLEVKVTGITIGGVSCDAGSNARIMTTDAVFSTELTLNFQTSSGVPNKVRGIFLDENGLVVSVRFSLTGGAWKGTAAFSGSGIYTLKYIEIDGEQYELSEGQRVKLELLLGIKASASITADTETQAKLDAIQSGSTPQRFTLDTGKRYAEGDKAGELILEDGSVTLQTQVKLFDNNGNPLIGMSGARLYYSRSGAASTLDTDLKWNGSTGYYEGEFLINQPGTYLFNMVTITENGKTSRITGTTEVASIQAMPPEPVSYFGNYTQAYQYAPDNGAAAVLGFDNSVGAAGITATFTKYSKAGVAGATFETQGVRTKVLEDDESVFLWSFPIPKDATNDSQQEGEWKLTGVKLDGVYYLEQGKKEPTFFGDENPLVLSLDSENIRTKVVSRIYVTLIGNSQTFTGNFMDSQQVRNMKVTLADYNGDAIEGVSYSNVRVSYPLLIKDAKTFHYTTSDLSDVIVSANGTKQNDTTYAIGALDFRRAGGYTLATVSFDVTANGSTSTVEFKTGTVPGNIKYAFKGTDGTVLEQNPTYTVYWNQPDVKITGTNPKMGEIFNVNMAGGKEMAFLPAQNYYEDYYAVLGFKTTKETVIVITVPYYTAPQVTFQMQNGGKNYQSAVLEGHTKIGNDAITCGFSFPTGKDLPTVTGYMGRVGSADQTSGSSTRGTVNEDIKTIKMTYNGIEYVLDLANTVVIRGSNSPKPQLDYVVPEAYSGYITLPETRGGRYGDGRSFTETLPSMTFTKTEPPAGVTVDQMGTPKTTTQIEKYYYSVITTDGCGNETITHYPVTRTIETKVYQKEMPASVSKYSVTSWTVEGAVYNTADGNDDITEWRPIGTGSYKPGSKITPSGRSVTDGNNTISISSYWRATPVCTLTETAADETVLVTCTVTTTKDTKGNGQSNVPSGAAPIDESKVLSSPEVITNWGK